MEEYKYNTTITFDDIVSTDEETLTIRGYANKYTNDVGEVVIDSHQSTLIGVNYDLTEYEKNPILYYAHDLDRPVGKTTKLSITDRGLYIEAVIFKSVAPEVYAMVKNKIVTSFSVGVVVTGSEWSDILNATVLKDVLLFDISVVTVPSNLESKIDQVDMCSLGICSTVRSKLPSTKNTREVDKAIVEAMVKKVLYNK